MSFKSFASRLFAAYIHRQNQSWINNPVQAQEKTFKKLIQKARATQFGKDHDFSNIHSIEDFQKRVPVRDYEALKPYVDQIIDGASDILWPGKPLYFAKTSGTTSGAKYIPITKESMPTHIKSARNAILNYIYQSKKSKFVDGKMIFLQGSPVLGETAGIKTGRLSGIVAHYVPAYLQKNRMPSYETNCIEDWETKVEKIIDETLQENMSIISGIPSWVQMYFERIQQRTGKPIGEVFPDFNLFIYGGVNYKPYQQRFDQLIGRSIDSIELFPASEGFIAYSTDQESQDMLLLLNNDIFYEFIPADRFFEENPPRLSLSEIELGVSYALILSSSAGLWA
ncbi:MAG: GH3 auxin-responsive promoter family protein, partial [Flavobacteriaceae bacterium]|nr:GH3 auxin-responsive promoter family protein [Flavobacteriaceae bacterium]